MSGFACRITGAVLALLAVFSLSSCSDSNGYTEPFSVTGTIEGCRTDSVFVFVARGSRLDRLEGAAAAKVDDKDGAFSISGKLPRRGIYFVGTAQENARMLILGGDEEVKITGSCDRLREAKVTNSKSNTRLEEAIALMQKFQARLQQAYGPVADLDMEARRNQKVPDEKALAEAEASFLAASKAVAADQIRAYDSLKKVDPLLAKIFSVTIYERYDPANPGKYTTAIEHFEGIAFRYADPSDPDFAFIPQFSQTVKTYAMTMYQAAPDRAETAVNTLLGKAEKGSHSRRVMLISVIEALLQLQEPAVGTYLQQYVAEFPQDAVRKDEYNGILVKLEPIMREREQEAAILAIGKEAPEIVLPNPAGQTLKLSDLRGKVVMIDFWASWCKPCRAENPNVVRMYNELKGKGFEIFGVSLDQTKDAWVKAIAQDKLTWPQVSDLKFWQSAAAQTYFIKSIPATVLIDRDGKIIARNLRGKALEDKLREVLK